MSPKGGIRKLQDSRHPVPAQQRATEPQRLEDGTIVISEKGDVVLNFRASFETAKISFRVEASSLARSSAFFHRLLFDQRFAEGKNISEAHQALMKNDQTFADTSVAQLPQVDIEDVGQISTVKTIRPLMRDLLLILHGRELTVTRLPLVNLANLAVTADRFDCAPTIAQYTQTRGLLTASRVSGSSQSEEAIRQKLLIAILLQIPQGFGPLSRELMHAQSERWNVDVNNVMDEALWWNLPRGIEEEVRSRRRYVLMSISSLQSHLLDAYTSRARQCKLGYDTSPQCDSFHCGELIRFLSRKCLLRFESCYQEPVDTDGFVDSIENLIDALRQCPNYQLDINHPHCGPRKVLLQGLSIIEGFSSRFDGPGICLECWIAPNASRRSWAESKPLPVWNSAVASRHASGIHVHGDTTIDAARDFFTSVEKQWSTM
ncbi:MAG: hypothetical protein M1828_005089 [Chrysothrix sp. TS-e1954]|nr:MAG: hypothetical protein M1828_005089 [Chrysothrix sp. TS-e1954]